MKVNFFYSEKKSIIKCNNLLRKLLAIKKNGYARHQWLMPVTLATQKAEIRRITGSKPV
jgi:hypothetical protein